MLILLTIIHLVQIIAVAVSSINNGAPADDFQPRAHYCLIGFPMKAELMYLIY